MPWTVLIGLAHRSTAEHWLKLRPGKLLWNMSEQGKTIETRGHDLLIRALSGWAKAAWSFFSAWNAGAALFVWDDRGSFDAKNMLDLLHEYPITTLCAPPLAWRQLVQPKYQQHYRKYPPRALETCHAAGESLAASVLVEWRRLSATDILEGYGQTETVLLCGYHSDIPVRPGSMGKPIPGVPLQIIDAEGDEAADDAEGDIALVLSDNSSEAEDGFFGIFDGYLDQKGGVARKVKEVSIGTLKRSCYLTGDRAIRDEDGYLWFVGRSDDVINTAGYRIGTFSLSRTPPREYSLTSDLNRKAHTRWSRRSYNIQQSLKLPSFRHLIPIVER